MSSWSSTLADINKAESAIDSTRRRAIADLSLLRGRNVICYYSGWLMRPQISESSISDNDTNGLMNAICGMDRSKGLDLVLHTPGGDLAATESIVNYLRDCFGDDIVAIVPQMAMSAGTMIACSCKSVIMGRQSSLGPTDPQMGGVAAGGVIDEFERAVRDVTENPASAALWGTIIGKYHPTFLGDCQNVVEMSRKMVGDWLMSNMLKGDPDAEDKVASITGKLCDHSSSVMHNRHFSHSELSAMGIKVEMMEDDDSLQDAIMTLHHLFMITFQKTSAVKIIESGEGSSWIVGGSSS